MDTIALYIHWPFCLSKCPYCDFNSHVAERIDQGRWREGLLRELERGAARVGRRRLTSVFFGGGTPSLMDPATTAALIDRATALFEPAADIEITLEANPGAVDRERFQGFRIAGVNRVSLGVQSLHEDALRFLERRHDVAEARRAVEAAQALFPRSSFDLIYARPGQAPEDWRGELRAALAMAGEHLSLYQLTIEDGTRFAADHRRGAFALPDDDNAIALWDVTQEETERAGLPRYEVSNHARPGAESRHNLTYWRGGDYLGIGPGAHGRLTVGEHTYATRQHRAPEIWLKLSESEDGATRENIALTARERQEELVLMGLRTTAGIDADRFARLSGGVPLDQAVDGRALAWLREEGLVAEGWPLRVTSKGVLCLNSVISALLDA
ncbi:radical SAM family heme chaperone HemW [Novispirillum sp. DQ9]|uniref:radical SAM family heme chaperone HemW n=1 Tax=Novispirillum sp. DQ9 TaxID=3398612 RepID=UPI003C797AC8